MSRVLHITGCTCIEVGRSSLDHPIYEIKRGDQIIGKIERYTSTWSTTTRNRIRIADHKEHRFREVVDGPRGYGDLRLKDAVENLVKRKEGADRA